MKLSRSSGKNKNRYFAVIAVLAILLALLIFAGAVYALVIMASVSENPPISGKAPPPPIIQKETYNGGGFSISYPIDLSPEKDSGEIIFRHSVPFRHPDFCNLKDPSFLENFTDFSLTINSATGTIVDAMIADKIITDESEIAGDQIKKANIASLSGYMTEIGVEGCGLDIYYFDLMNGRTLIVKKSLVPEYSDINANKKVFLELPGIITPEDGDKLFNGIISGVVSVK